MRRASVRDLRYAFKEVENSLAAGEPIEIVKRNKVIAYMTPVPPKTPSKVDFEATIKEIWGDETPSFSLIDLISEGRERF